MSSGRINPYARVIKTIKNAAQQQSQNAGLQRVNTSYPGENMDLTLDQVKDIIDNSEKVIGVVFQSASGQVTPTIKFPATAKYLLGFSFSTIANLPDTFSLSINEEKAITTASAYAYSNRVGTPDSPYFEFVRVIGGATAMELAYNSATGGETIVFTCHYV